MDAVVSFVGSLDPKRRCSSVGRDMESRRERTIAFASKVEV
jgi:hypothetical protein